jgi:hypothetical protein
MSKNKSESIGSVPMNSGVSSAGKGTEGTIRNDKLTTNQSAELVREQHPNGSIVVHAVRKSGYVHYASKRPRRSTIQVLCVAGRLRRFSVPAMNSPPRHQAR